MRRSGTLVLEIAMISTGDRQAASTSSPLSGRTVSSAISSCGILFVAPCSRELSMAQDSDLAAFLKDAGAFLRRGHGETEPARDLVRRLGSIIERPKGSEMLKRYYAVKRCREVLAKLATSAGPRFTYDLLIVETGWHLSELYRPDDLSDEDLRDNFDELPQRRGFRSAEPGDIRDARRRADERSERLKRQFAVEMVPRGC